MKKAPEKVKSQASERKIDMAEHGYRVKALGLSGRATKLLKRILIILVPVILFALWFFKYAK